MISLFQVTARGCIEIRYCNYAILSLDMNWDAYRGIYVLHRWVQCAPIRQTSGVDEEKLTCVDTSLTEYVVKITGIDEL